MSHADDHAGTGEGTRRDFLYYATAGAGVVATGAAVWPLVNQMNPSADTRALAARYGLPVADKPDSQDICFVPNGDYAAVIEKLRPGAADPGQIVDLLGVEQATIANTLNRMERDGLITRQADKADKRSRRIYLTPKALALREQAQAALDRVNDQAGQGLYSSERDRFASLVTKVIGNLAD